MLDRARQLSYSFLQVESGAVTTARSIALFICDGSPNVIVGSSTTARGLPFLLALIQCTPTSIHH